MFFKKSTLHPRPERRGFTVCQVKCEITSWSRKIEKSGQAKTQKKKRRRIVCFFGLKRARGLDPKPHSHSIAVWTLLKPGFSICWIKSWHARHRFSHRCPKGPARAQTRPAPRRRICAHTRHGSSNPSPFAHRFRNRPRMHTFGRHPSQRPHAVIPVLWVGWLAYTAAGLFFHKKPLKNAVVEWFREIRRGTGKN